jgi:hypothetical protein
MVRFYFTFSFSHPYEPLIPIGGLETDLFFSEGPGGSGGPGDPRNRALVAFRRAATSRDRRVLAWMDRASCPSSTNTTCGPTPRERRPGPPCSVTWPVGSRLTSPR